MEAHEYIERDKLLAELEVKQRQIKILKDVADNFGTAKLRNQENVLYAQAWDDVLKVIDFGATQDAAPLAKARGEEG